MIRVPVEDLLEGQVLAADVLDGRGGILLGKGTAISDRHREMLMRRSVTEVLIVEAGGKEDDAVAGLATEGDVSMTDDKADAASAEEEAARLKRVAEVDHAFDDVRDHPLMSELYRIALRHAEQGSVG